MDSNDNKEYMTREVADGSLIYTVYTYYTVYTVFAVYIVCTVFTSMLYSHNNLFAGELFKTQCKIEFTYASHCVSKNVMPRRMLKNVFISSN